MRANFRRATPPLFPTPMGHCISSKQPRQALSESPLEQLQREVRESRTVTEAASRFIAALSVRLRAAAAARDMGAVKAIAGSLSSVLALEIAKKG